MTKISDSHLGSPEAADELTQAIAQAIHDRKLQAAVALLKRLALTDPARAQQVLDTIELGLQMAGGRDADADPDYWPAAAGKDGKR